MKLTLTISGEERSFPEQDLVEIVQNYFIIKDKIHLLEMDDGIADPEGDSYEAMKVVLRVNGDYRSFSRKELTLILTEYLDMVKAIPRPTPGKEFLVDPMAINREYFLDRRKDPEQEKARQWICIAFSELDANPERYARRFASKLPVDKWTGRSAKELDAIISRLGGDHAEDFVEYGFELAQRIKNGEPWCVVCNDPDSNDCLWRLIVWRDRTIRIVGGKKGCKNDVETSATHIKQYDCAFSSIVRASAPVGIFYHD